MTGRRLDAGGLVDRTRAVSFSFDGRAYTGFSGDTLASALLAQGVMLFGRSFKYHRPRGVTAAGVEEPNALVSAGRAARFEPNTRATDIFVYDGLEAVSQNRWPGLAMDLGAVNRWIAPFIPAGFYYKTFFGGPKLWLMYEGLIRRAAGLGAAPTTPDADTYEHRAAFCDVLVVGSGPAGLAAAEAAAACGARVILVEQDGRLGGSLLTDEAEIGGADGLVWAQAVAARVAAAGGRVLTRTSAAGYWDHDLVTLVERRVEAGQAPPGPALAQRLWRVRAARVVLAPGALERPLLFAGNDLPGVMLSGAVRTYARRFGVLAGQRVAIATSGDDAYRTALAIQEAGGEVAVVLDSRPASASPLAQRVAMGAPVCFGAQPLEARGGRGGVSAVLASTGGAVRRFDCDLLAVSGGFTPAVQLHMQAGGGLTYDAAFGAFTPTAPRQGQSSAGAAAGRDSLSGCLEDGWAAGAAAARGAGARGDPGARPCAGAKTEVCALGAATAPAEGVDLKTAFIDLQNDVTAADVDLAWREGYRSVEHLKRYTTLGMATDQGKTSNLLGLARLAAHEARPMEAIGLTTFRPPYTPVTLGVLAGEAVGAHTAPLRRGPLHAVHTHRNALWQPSGLWTRPRAFPRTGESLGEAALREARAVRTAAGLTDVSTLAKFEVAGPDAAAFLERVCATTVARLAVGRGRYTFMLREDGLVVDDGTVWRIGAQRFLLTSSTGGADRMTAHLSYVRKILAPELNLSVASVQERWAAAALAGPRAREILAAHLDGAPPRHMAATTGRIAGVAVQVLAASYSGERAFEVYAGAHEMEAVWGDLAAATHDAGGALYGLDALELLRIEKGHVEVGAEIDGRRTPADLGLARMLNPRGGYVGAACLMRPALVADGRQALVGLEADGPIPEGAMLVARPGAPPEGHVTSAGQRLLPRIRAQGETGAGGGGGAEIQGVALGLLAGGLGRLGERLVAASPTRGLSAPVRVVEPHFHDPAGERYRD